MVKNIQITGLVVDESVVVATITSLCILRKTRIIIHYFSESLPLLLTTFSINSGIVFVTFILARFYRAMIAELFSRWRRSGNWSELCEMGEMTRWSSFHTPSLGIFLQGGLCVSFIKFVVNAIHDQKCMLYSVYSTSIVVTCRRDSASHCQSLKKLPSDAISVAYHAV